jgi:tRNA nucleotidyltransferase (CCA-adding enzyme)
MHSGVTIKLSAIPRQVMDVMERLGRQGFSVYLVGGVVRDIIQGREPRDYDITTGATPDQVRGLFERVVPTGEKHGTVTIVSGHLGIEVTTLRRDGCYSDSRRPDTVQFTGSLREDLCRRDFTINSLAADLEGRVYDFFGGLEDISSGIIRAVGNPEKRFREDGLRMMRALRIACQTGFDIEKKTLESISLNSRRIARVSMERIREELGGILVSPAPHRGVELMSRCGLMAHIIPELDGYPGLDRGNPGDRAFGYTLAMLKNTPARLHVRLAALLYLLGAHCPPAADTDECRYRRHRDASYSTVEEILDRLKYDRKTVRSVAALVGERMAGVDAGREKSIKKFISRVEPESLEDIFSLWRAAAVAGENGNGSAVKALEKRVEDILRDNLPLRIKDLAVNGNDLKGLGIRQGREMGRLLHRLLEVVLEKPEKNDKDVLISLARQWRKAQSPGPTGEKGRRE